MWLQQLSVASLAASVTDAVLHVTSASNDHSADFLSQIARSRGNMKPEELARAIVEEIISSAAIWSATIGSVIDYYLDDSRDEERIHLVASNDEQVMIAIKKALSTSHKAVSSLSERVLGANPPFTTVRRRARKQANIDGELIEAGTDVLISLVDANVCRTQLTCAGY
jgi:cytochrome P450